jgi:YVTN family beta-propeller protein
MKRFPIFIVLFAALLFATAASGQQPRFQVLAFYSTSVSLDHVQFAEDALKFFGALAATDNFRFDATTHWEDMNEEHLKAYQVVIWLNYFPTNTEQRRAFQRYIEAGGTWLGFHVAGYNDKDTNWPWFVDFLGGGVFHMNNWPPLPARLVVDDRTHPVTRNLPDAYVSPANEWYGWKPSPRLNKNVRVLVTLDPSNYPLGLKNVLASGDLPVVWTNTKYKMIYMNIGHGDKIFTSAIQNRLIGDATNWLGTISTQAEVPAAAGVEISANAVVVNARTNKVYAVSPRSSAITVVDGGDHSTAMVKVGSEPKTIAVNPLTNRIYVGNSGDGTVTVIEGATDTVVATVKVGDFPYVVAVNPVTNKVYVSKIFSNSLTVIDGATNGTTPLEVGVQADAIAVNPVTNKIYLTSYQAENVTVIDGATDNVTRVTAGTHLWGMAVNPVTDKVYLANIGRSNITVINAATNAITAVDTGNMPCAVAVDPGANKVYAVNYASDSVTVIDGANNSVIATVNVGVRPQAIAIDTVTHTVYVANTHSNNVTVIDGTSYSVTAMVNAGNGPYAIAVDTAANRAFVTNIAEDSLTVIDGTTTRRGTSAPIPAKE